MYEEAKPIRKLHEKLIGLLSKHNQVWERVQPVTGVIEILAALTYKKLPGVQASWLLALANGMKEDMGIGSFMMAKFKHQSQEDGNEVLLVVTTQKMMPFFFENGFHKKGQNLVW